jgi:eukaryotic-like serine/threonine-protein kinase
VKNLTKILAVLYLAIIMIAVACKKEDPAPSTPTTPPVATKSSAKDITKFSFAGLSPVVDATIDATTKAITATVPAGTDVTKLVPTITLSDKATVSPATGVATDFSKEVSYTVTAEDGSTVIWKVIVTLAKPVDGGTVYIGNYDGVLYALDAQAGTKKWQVQMPAGIASTPTVANGTIYIGCIDKKLYALDVADGKKKWEFLHGKPNDQSAPMVANGLVYIGGNPKIYALDANTGTKKWEFEGDGIYSWEASPNVVNGIVYGIIRGNSGGKYGMYALDATTGAVKWGPANDVYLSESSPAIADGVVYAGSELNGLVALNATTGSTKWSFYPNKNLFCSYSSPTISNGIVYIGSLVDRKLYAVDAISGAKKWDFLTGGDINSSPIVANGIVYVGSGDYKLYAIDATSGTKKWEAQTDIALVDSSPVVVGGLVYIAIDKKVLAFDATTGTKKWEYATARGFGSSSPCIVDKDGKIFHAGVSGMVQ